MYCGKCGKEIPDDGSFCPFCGDKTIRYASPQTSREPEQTQAPERKKTIFSNPKKMNRGVLLLLAAAVAIVMFNSNKSGASSPDKAVENMASAVVERDVGDLIKYSTYNETCQKELGNSKYDVNEVRKQLNNEYKNNSADTDKTEYKITGTNKLNGNELDEIKERLKIYYKNVDKIQEIDVVKLKENVGSEDISEDFYCLKVKDRWYVSIELQQQD